MAISDPLNVTALPLCTLSPKQTWEELGRLVQVYGIRTLVVGIPIRTDGQEGEKARKVRAWIEEARKHLKGVEIEAVDERLTTALAQRLLHERGMKAREQKKYLDQLSAALILETYLQKRHRPGS